MQPTYQNSKGEDVVIAEMETRHLIYAICKHSRALGEGGLDVFTEDQKKNEIKHMHEELEKRAAAYKYVDAFATAIREYESDTFSAEASDITRAEAETIALDYVRIGLGELIEKQEVNLTADGLALWESLDKIREND